MSVAMIIAVWVVGALLLLAGELWAVLNDQPGDTITHHVKLHWWTRGAMGALIIWSGWHFFTDEGGWIDLWFVAAGFAAGVAADRLRLRRG